MTEDGIRRHVAIVGSYRPVKCKGKKKCPVVANISRSRVNFEENVNNYEDKG